MSSNTPHQSTGEYFDESSTKRLADLSILSSSEESDSDPTDSEDSEDFDYDYDESDNGAESSDDGQVSNNSSNDKSKVRTAIEHTDDSAVTSLFLTDAERKEKEEQEQKRRDSLQGSAKTGPVLRPVHGQSNMMSIFKQLEKEEGQIGVVHPPHPRRGRSRRKHEDEDDDEEDDEEARARRSLLSDNTARNRSGRRRLDYASYKKHIIHPNTAFDLASDDPRAEVPYTSDNEEARDARRAAELNMEVSQIYSNSLTKRMFRTVIRGALDDTTPLKSFLVASDLSPEANHALEWTIGTVLRDSDLLIVVCCFEDDKATINTSTGSLALGNGSNVPGTPSASGAASASNTRAPSPSAGPTTLKFDEQVRMKAMAALTVQTEKLLRKTRLQVRVVLEVLHCKNPRHMITEIIDHVNPTLVVVGSRGRSALKGVLLGSFSNYVVERSSVPVMVARKKLQKAKNRDLNVRLANNLRVHKLADARID